MNKHIPYEKLSKKAKKAIDARQRGSWGGLNPITRRTPNPKAYQRSKARNWRNDSNSALFCYVSSAKIYS